MIIYNGGLNSNCYFKGSEKHVMEMSKKHTISDHMKTKKTFPSKNKINNHKTVKS